GLFGFFSAGIGRVGSSALRMFLYHIPPQTVLGLSLDLVGRLIKAYPDTVVGLKDSSGDWNNTAALLERFPGFAIFPGSEVFLLDGLRHGAVGCITASGNVNVPGIRKVYENWRTPQADALQAEITTVRKTIQAYRLAKRRLQEHLSALLPEWFAQSDSNLKYAAQSEVLSGYVARLDGEPKGLLLLKKHSAISAEIYWLGVDPRCHRRGLGRA